MDIKKNVSLLPYNTFGIDVKADCFIEYASVEDLQAVLNLELVKSTRILALGGGSNLLFLSDFKGTILHSKINYINLLQESEESVFIEVGSGVIWDDFVAFCVKNKWYGAENLSLIPGQVGAAAVQNIGAYGVEIKDFITEVHAVEIDSSRLVVFNNSDCEYDYRSSVFKNKYKGKYIVSSIVVCLRKKEYYSLQYQDLESSVQTKGGLSLKNVRDTVIDIRNKKLPDPTIQGNAGSFFKNPTISQVRFFELLKQYPNIVHYSMALGKEKISAAWLIDSCGWKGKKMVNVGVHEKQALVLVNLGNASGEEVLSLAEEIKESVKKKFDIILEPEVNYIS